jgi:hypothetical protein
VTSLLPRRAILTQIAHVVTDPLSGALFELSRNEQADNWLGMQLWRG